MIFWFYLSPAVVDLMKYNSQNSSENLYKALVLFHAARLMTRLISVRPAVDLTWKALT